MWCGVPLFEPQETAVQPRRVPPRRKTRLWRIDTRRIQMMKCIHNMPMGTGSERDAVSLVFCVLLSAEHPSTLICCYQLLLASLCRLRKNVLVGPPADRIPNYSYMNIVDIEDMCFVLLFLYVLIRFNTIFDNLVVAYLFGPPCRRNAFFYLSCVK